MWSPETGSFQWENLQDKAVICLVASTADAVVGRFPGVCVGPHHAAAVVLPCFRSRVELKPPAVCLTGDVLER